MSDSKISLKEELDKLQLIEDLEHHGYTQDVIDTIMAADQPENLVGPFTSVKDLMRDLKS